MGLCFAELGHLGRREIACWGSVEQPAREVGAKKVGRDLWF